MEQYSSFSSGISGRGGENHSKVPTLNLSKQTYPWIEIIQTKHKEFETENAFFLNRVHFRQKLNTASTYGSIFIAQFVLQNWTQIFTQKPNFQLFLINQKLCQNYQINYRQIYIKVSLVDSPTQF